MHRELLLGCGHSREKRIRFDHVPQEWQNLTTLDHQPPADVIHDLDNVILPFEDEFFDEIHAYEVLEHCGKQGDWKFFFDQFAEFYRILKPGGWFCGTVPMWNSPWAFADPSHTRVIPKEMLSFLDQTHYDQCGEPNNPSSDFRSYWKGDFITRALTESRHTLKFVLQKN